MSTHEALTIVGCLSGFVAGIQVGIFLWHRKVQFWRIKWIEMEHTLARLQQREPKHIDSVKEP